MYYVKLRYGEYSSEGDERVGGNMRDGQDLHGAFSGAENMITQTDGPQAGDYLEDLKGDDYDSLSESQKIELLESLIVIMKSFVNLGHDLDPVNKLIAEFEISSEEPVPVIDLEDATDDER